MSLTISGGVSLGAYQAGYLYYATHAVQHDAGAPPLRLLTGASAGSLNALITALTLCRAERPDPADSLFWQAWIDVGYRELFDPARATALSVLSRVPMERIAGRLKAVWRQGLDAACDLVLGITVTRLHSALVSIHDDLEVPRQEEKFSLRIRGRGPGRPPRLTNYVDSGYHLPQPLLPLSDDDGD